MIPDLIKIIATRYHPNKAPLSNRAHLSCSTQSAWRPIAFRLRDVLVRLCKDCQDTGWVGKSMRTRPIPESML
jgi:hypothetical protein